MQVENCFTVRIIMHFENCESLEIGSINANIFLY